MLACFVGDRSRESARQLWRRIPAAYRERVTLLTSGVERFNCTLRQRVSRLVRKTLSFSKKLANHIGAIKYFICHYNREVMRFM